jgi:hypothetical protein
MSCSVEGESRDDHGSAALSSPVGIGIVVGRVVIDRLPRHISEMILESCECFGRPVPHIGYGNLGLDIMLRRVNMAIADRSVGRDGHVESNLQHRYDRIPLQV